MERLTIPDVIVDENTTRRTIIDASEVRKHAMEFYWRLKSVEDILGDDYDLDRLRELVEADRDGRCVVLPISTPSMAYTVDSKGGYISSGFYRTPGAVLHDTERGYVIVKTREAAEAALKGEKNG